MPTPAGFGCSPAGLAPSVTAVAAPAGSRPGYPPGTWTTSGLYAVGVVEERPRSSPVRTRTSRAALDRHPLLGHPSRSVVDDSPRLGGKRDVADATV